MANADISSTPTSTMTPEAVRAEARQLRHRIAEVQAELAKRRIWAMVDRKETDRSHLTWLANTRGLNGKLQARYSLVRAAEKDLNSKQHQRSHKRNMAV